MVSSQRDIYIPGLQWIACQNICEKKNERRNCLSAISPHIFHMCTWAGEKKIDYFERKRQKYSRTIRRSKRSSEANKKNIVGMKIHNGIGCRKRVQSLICNNTKVSASDLQANLIDKKIDDTTQRSSIQSQWEPTIDTTTIIKTEFCFFFFPTSGT